MRFLTTKQWAWVIMAFAFFSYGKVSAQWYQVVECFGGFQCGVFNTTTNPPPYGSGVKSTLTVSAAAPTFVGYTEASFVITVNSSTSVIDERVDWTLIDKYGNQVAANYGYIYILKTLSVATLCNVSGLQPGETYYLKIIIRNNLITNTANPFTTRSCQAPILKVPVVYYDPNRVYCNATMSWIPSSGGAQPVSLTYHRTDYTPLSYKVPVPGKVSYKTPNNVRMGTYGWYLTSQCSTTASDVATIVTTGIPFTIRRSEMNLPFQAPTDATLTEIDLEKEQVSHRKIDIYPNPASNEFSIILGNAEETIQQVVLRNVIGQTVYSRVNDDSRTVNINDLTPGIYYYTVKTNVGSYSGKVLKE